jgi:hypothetical protein
MIKLHKKASSAHEFWEAWTANDKIIVHTGIVGNRGQRSVSDVHPSEDPEAVIQQQAALVVATGFTPVVREEMTSLVINFKLSSWGDKEDLETRHYIEDLVHQALGWTGNGHCSGGEIGSGIMNIWCLVLEPGKAVSAISSELETTRLADGAVIAKYDDGSASFLAIWPDSQVGTEVEV